jgi:hypothetical protein
MLRKLNGLILGCIFLFVTPLLGMAQTNSEILGTTHVARVIVPRAVVYSDESMNSPLGYISNDKLITVGNPRKKNPDLVPLVVYGRLAFIESKSIHFENESVELQTAKRGAPREHNIDIVLTKPEEKLSENNSVYFDVHQFGGGENTKNLFSAVSGEEKQSYLGAGLSFIHRQPIAKLFWGAGFEYNSISDSNIKYRIFMLRPILGFTVMKTPLFLLDVTGGVDFSGGAQLEINNTIDTRDSSFMWGPSFGVRAVFFPNNKYHLFGGLSYRHYKVLRLETLHDLNDNEIDGIHTISGADISIGLSIEL